MQVGLPLEGEVQQRIFAPSFDKEIDGRTRSIVEQIMYNPLVKSLPGYGRVIDGYDLVSNPDTSLLGGTLRQQGGYADCVILYVRIKYACISVIYDDLGLSKGKGGGDQQGNDYTS